MKLFAACFIFLCPALLLSKTQDDIFESALRAEHLETFQPNDIVFVTDHGETRLQFLLSLKYRLISTESFDWGLGPYQLKGLDLAYDGLYDFYFWTRHSQPVISRLQHPGLYFSFDAPQQDRLGHMDGFDLGWFHESNGQVMDTLAEYNAAFAKEGLRARDAISRAWDYWYLSSKFTFHPYDAGATQMRFSFTPTLRIFTGAQGIIYRAEQEILWAPQDPPSTIYDYDGIRGLFLMEWVFPHRSFNYLGLSGEFRTGYNFGHFGQHWSKQVSLTFKTWRLPWYLYYSNGFGPYISDYSTQSESYGVGIRIW